MSDPNFYQYLLDVPQVASLIGDRIYPIRAPQSELRPFVVWVRSGVERQQTYCGANAVVRAEYTFSCYGSTPDEAQSVHLAIRNAMQDFAGLMGDVHVKHCFLRDDFDLEDEDPDIYSVRQLWEVH